MGICSAAAEEVVEEEPYVITNGEDVSNALQEIKSSLNERLETIEGNVSSLSDQMASMETQLAEVARIVKIMGKGMDMDGCGRFMKYSMFVANFIIFLGGSAVLGIGVWTLADKSFINELLGTNLFMGAVYVMIATGALVAILAFFGCIGAAKEIKCMLLLYFLLVMVIFVVMLVGGVLGYVFRETVHHSMEQQMTSSIRAYGENRAVTNAWDTTQETLKCCGVTTYQDWQDRLPESCCTLDENGQKTQCRYNSELIYQNGCLEATEIFVRDHAAILAGAGIGVACLMLLGMIFSFALFKSIE